jgi:SAM-dependent methyltransferase
MLAPAMDPSYAAKYAEMHARHWWFRSREEYVLRYLRRVAGDRRSLRILDVGCGDGLMWKALEPFGQVDGIEPDASLLSPGSPHRDRIEVAPFPAPRPRQPYDVILMLDVLEHIEDDRGALASVFELLRPGGHFLLTVPALMLLWSEFDELNRHYRRYRRGQLRGRLQDAGFEVLSARYYFFWSLLPLLGRRLLFRSEASEESAFLKVPPAPVNSLLRAVSDLEHRVTSRVPVPFGSSLIAAARRPG